MMRTLPGIISAGEVPEVDSLLTDLVSWFPLTEKTGTRFDVHGTNHLNEYPVNVHVPYGTGVVGNAAQFTASGDNYLKKISPAGIDLSGDVTVAGWWNEDITALTSGYTPVAFSLDDNVHAVLQISEVRTNHGTIPKRLYPAFWDSVNLEYIVAASVDQMVEDTWYFIIVEWDAAAETLTATVDDGILGTPVSTVGTAGAANSDTLSNLYLGGAIGTVPTWSSDGFQNQWGIWNRKLTGAEQARLYNTGSGMAYPGAGPTGKYHVANSYDAGTGGTSRTIDAPEGLAEGDFLVMVGLTRNAVTALPTGGATWIELDNWAVNSGSITNPITTQDEQCRVWYKVAGASEPSTYSVGYTDQGTDGIVLLCSAWRNVSQIVSYAAAFGDIAPTVTANAGDTLLSFHGTSYDSSPQPAEPSGMIKLNGHYLTSPDVGLLWAFESNLGAGATGGRTFIGTWNQYAIAGNLLLR